MVEVFKTDVQDVEEGNKIINLLLNEYPAFTINFDLDDIDRILRVEGPLFNIKDISSCLNRYGHICVHLPMELG